MSQKDTPKKNIYTAYNLVWGKCSDRLKSNLESLNNYVMIQKNSNIFELMKHIKNIIFKDEEQDYSQDSAYNGYRRFYNTRKK